MNKNTNCIVIGSGQSGRGYVARFLAELGYEITFVDKNQKLIDAMNEDKSYSVHFYEKNRTPVNVTIKKAYNTTTPILDSLTEDTIFFVSVGESNLGEVAKYFRSYYNSAETLRIVLNENGTNPRQVMEDALRFEGIEDFEVSQTAIFCTTVNLDKTRLDILSQNENEYAYDQDGITFNLPFNGAIRMSNFPKYLERKIYTYNSVAGLISYYGYILGMEDYSIAANNMFMNELMEKLTKPLNLALAQYFEIDKHVQDSFSSKALRKMKDKRIVDFVIKNGRDAKRKLGETERIIAPIQILKKYNFAEHVRVLELEAACAIRYWENVEGNHEALEDFLSQNASFQKPIDTSWIEYYYHELKKIGEFATEEQLKKLLSMEGF